MTPAITHAKISCSGTNSLPLKLMRYGLGGVHDGLIIKFGKVVFDLLTRTLPTKRHSFKFWQIKEI